MFPALTEKIKSYAFQLGADLVGIANIERFAHAPLEMSPKGLLPEAQSVIVCALHHPDGCIEMGGREHPQKMGPYAVQGFMNTHLDHISYEMARYLEDLGYEAIPIAASNIWRYRGYKNLRAVFAPDMSHIYAAVAAGLTELGYHGISMSPEFGPRNRFVSIVTTAPLVPTPLLPGNTLCDRCYQCVKQCLSGALSEEVDGTEDLLIEDRCYTKAKKNLWRCSWGEHFGVDLDLPKPAVVTEENIIETIRQHGLRGGEMGSCLRYCLPPHLRLWDQKYTNAPRRKRIYVPDESIIPPPSPLERANEETKDRQKHSLSASSLQERWMPRHIQDPIIAAAYDSNIDFVWIHDETQMTEIGLDYKQRLPDAIRGVTMGVAVPNNESCSELRSAARYFAERAAFLAARKLEDFGYSVVVCADLPPAAMASVVQPWKQEGWEIVTATFLTSAPLTPRIPEMSAAPADSPPQIYSRVAKRDLTKAVKKAAESFGVDLVGIASSERLTELKAQLSPLMDGETILDATNRGQMWLEYDVEVTRSTRRVKDAYDYLPTAKAVLVMGLRLPQATVRRVGEPPSEAVGPYVFAQYVTQWILREKALQMIKWLKGQGYKAEMSLDLMSTGSYVANPRGLQPNVFCNRFAAICAGLGVLTKGGFVTTEEFGPNMRFVAVITDAPLQADEIQDLQSGQAACWDCQICRKVCPSQAYQEEIALSLEGQQFSFYRLDQKRCDWTAKFALLGGDGIAKMGVNYEVAPPAQITPEALREAMRGFDAVQGHHRCAVESCVVHCPLARLNSK